jgi:hypothetical protein
MKKEKNWGTDGRTKEGKGREERRKEKLAAATATAVEALSLFHFFG